MVNYLLVIVSMAVGQTTDIKEWNGVWQWGEREGHGRGWRKESPEKENTKDVKNPSVNIWHNKNTADIIYKIMKVNWLNQVA